MFRNNKLIKNIQKLEASLEGLKLREKVESVIHKGLESNDRDQINRVSLGPLKLKNYCVTRWNLRRVGFQQMRMSYKALLKL